MDKRNAGITFSRLSIGPACRLRQQVLFSDESYDPHYFYKEKQGYTFLINDKAGKL